jgi:ankyrin repeat protein
MPSRIPDDTPLIGTIRRGHDDEVAALLAGGADPN